MRILVLICAMLPGVASGQTPTIQVWITGNVTVTTSESLTLTAVSVKGHMWRDSIRSGEHQVLFSITHANPIASKLNYTDREGSFIGRLAAAGPLRKNRLRRKCSGHSGFFKPMERLCFSLKRERGIPIHRTSDSSEDSLRLPSQTSSGTRFVICTVSDRRAKRRRARKANLLMTSSEESSDEQKPACPSPPADARRYMRSLRRSGR